MILLFSGYNPRAVLAVCRFLDNQNLEFSIIARSNADRQFLGRFWEKVKLVRSSEFLDVDEVIRICSEVCLGQECFIVPTTEYLNRVLVDNDEKLKDNQILSGLPSKEVYESLSDKIKFRGMCVDYGISVAKEVNSNYLGKCVKKPKTYEGDKPSILQKGEPVGDGYFLEEFVEGHSVYLLFSIPKKGTPVVFSQRNYLQQKEGGSITFAQSSSDWKDPVSTKCIKMLKDINFYGLAMIEFRFNGEDKVAIECNPRTWGPIQLTEDCNYNILARFFKDNGFPVSFAGPIKESYYLWKAGVDEYNTMHLGFSHNIDDYLDIDVYYRDMKKLQLLYDKQSKHSQYQKLPFIEGINTLDPLVNRYEDERWDYIKERVQFLGRSVVDIGGNTGYFSVRSSNSGSKTCMIEGNKDHAEFVENISEHLNLDITVVNKYISTLNSKVDICLFLNVLHHLGDDFLSEDTNYLESMSDMIKNVCINSDIIIFQMGYNWKGDTSLPLFKKGSKKEMVSFVKSCLPGTHQISFTGILDPITKKYLDSSDTLMDKFPEVGEFGNRPLFIITKRL